MKKIIKVKLNLTVTPRIKDIIFDEAFKQELNASQFITMLVNEYQEKNILTVKKRYDVESAEPEPKPEPETGAGEPEPKAKPEPEPETGAGGTTSDAGIEETLKANIKKQISDFRSKPSKTLHDILETNINNLANYDKKSYYYYKKSLNDLAFRRLDF